MENALDRPPAAEAPRVVLVTVPDAEAGRALARRLVEERLVACVNVLPGITSVYRWQGAIEEAAEALLVLKSTAGRIARLEARVKELHPYQVPEFVVLEPGHVGAAYLGWLVAETR